MLRVSENGPIGRQLFLESRLQVRWTRTEDESNLEAATIRVLDAFTSGGAQRSGGRRVLDFEAASDLDYVRGAHSLRTGILLEGGRYRSNDFSNYLGTYTFASLADYEAGRALSYTRRIGDPNIRYSNFQVGLYLQDDYRVARSLLLSYGVRYEAQTLIEDQVNFSAARERSPGRRSRAGRRRYERTSGYFTDWLGTGTYEQTQRIDGFRQQELNILNPGYPDPGVAGMTPPTNRYLLVGRAGAAGERERERGSRPGDHDQPAREHDVHLPSRVQVAARAQPQRARGRRPSRSAVQQRD